MPVIGTLTAEITASTSEFDAAVARTEQKVLSLAAGFEKNSSRIQKSFDAALNPATSLAAKISVLEGAGRSAGDIFSVFGKQIDSATAAAERHGQPIPALLQKYQAMGAAQREAASAAAEHAGRMDAVKGKLEGMLPSWAQGVTQFLNLETALVAATAAWVAFAAKAVMDTAAIGDNFDELSQKTGLSVEQLSSMELGLKQSGVSLESFGTAVKKLSINMVSADEDGKKATETFAKLGIDLKQTGGPYDTMMAVADVFANMPDGVEKTALAVDLFGKSGADIVPYLNQGRQAIEDLREESNLLGLTMGEDDARAAAGFSDAVDRLGAAWEGFRRTIGTSVLPALADLLEALTESKAVLELFSFALKSLKLYLTEFGPIRDLQTFSGLLRAVGLGGKEAGKGADEATVAIQGMFDPTNRTTESLKGLESAKKSTTEAAKALKIEQDEINKRYRESLIEMPFVRADTSALGKEIEKQAEAAQKAWVNTLHLNQENKDAGLIYDVNLPTIRRTGEILQNTLTPGLVGSATAWDVNTASLDEYRNANSGLGEQISTIMTDLGKGISEAIVEWKGFWQTLTDIAKQFATGILRSIIEPFTGGIMKSLSGLFTGGGGNFGENISKSLGGFLGTGAGSLGGKAFGLGMPGFGALGKIGSALFTGPAAPFVIGGMALAGGATALYKYISDPRRKASIEAQRDYGVSVGKGTIESFTQGLGFSSSDQWKGIRADLLSSPAFVQKVLLPQAKAEGTVAQLVQKFSEVRTAWGNADMSSALQRAIDTNVWTDLNEQWADLFEHSEALSQALPDFRNSLAAVGDTAEDVAARNLDKLNGKMRASLSLFTETGRMTGGFASKLRQAGIDDAGLLAQSGELRAATALQGEFGSLQSSLQQWLPGGAIASLPFEASEFLKSGVVSDALRARVSGMGGDISSFERFGEIVRAAAASELELAEYISKNGDAQESAAALYEELGGLQDTLGRQIEQMTQKFGDAIDKLVAALAALPDQIAAVSGGSGSAISTGADAARASAIVSEMERKLEIMRMDEGANPSEIARLERELAARRAELPPAAAEAYPGDPPPDDFGYGIPGMARGGRITRDGLAYLHAGESVGRSSGQVTFAPVINISGGAADSERNVKEVLLPGILRALESNFRGSRERLAISLASAGGAVL